MRKLHAFSLSTIALVMLSGSAGTAAAGPDSDDQNLASYLLRVPLPGPATDLEIITPEKYTKLNQAFCSKDEFSEKMLKDIDTVYKKALPVVFGTPEAPKDPIAEARQEVLGTAELTNEARWKLCPGKTERISDTQAAYHKALVRHIKEDGTTPAEKLREEGMTAEDKKDVTVDIWAMRLSGFKTAFQKYLSPTEI
ncbi:hypothetical protein NONI108955_06965 [Nocardia ninae]|uniref:DUF732 domain-containing protein n=1 Tax=Nocardia ninae NBRC 108245 TaxID=1210091 RepID=A0A511MRR0_9NOCA|nr:hypothetical protein [Nocardia ninae]GEM43259.1 hypothetical protein NN4_77780 [Nocardia ninae NBRC 108245]